MQLQACSFTVVALFGVVVRTSLQADDTILDSHASESEAQHQDKFACRDAVAALEEVSGDLLWSQGTAELISQKPNSSSLKSRFHPSDVVKPSPVFLCGTPGKESVSSIDHPEPVNCEDV